MTLWDDDVLRIEGIARQVAKEEIEPAIKALEMRVNDLEAKSAKLKELAEELGRQITNLKSEKPVTKSFSRK